MATYDEVVSLVRSFQTAFPRPGIPKLHVSALYDPRDPAQWRQSWPHAGEPGVYFIFDTSQRLLYVGVARLSIGKRLSAHLPGSAKASFVQPDWAAAFNVGYVAALPLPRDHWFEALAIEEYLIARLRPPVNVASKANIDEKDEAP